MTEETTSQPATTSTAVPTAGLHGIARIGKQMTRGETSGGAVFRAGDPRKTGTVKYPASTDFAEPKGQ